MKKHKCKIISILVIGVLLAGCQAVFNPYDDTFQCPKIDDGSCTSIPDAYAQSIDEKNEQDGMCTECGDMEAGQPIDAATPVEDAGTLYAQKRFERLHSLIDADTPPIVVPPEVGRMLVLSYTGTENELFGFRYVYFFVSDPSWLLSTASEKRMEGGN